MPFMAPLMFDTPTPRSARTSRSFPAADARSTTRSSVRPASRTVECSAAPRTGARRSRLSTLAA